MILWDKLEVSGRYVFSLDESWYMFSVKIKDKGIAEVQFSKKDSNGRFDLKQGVKEGILSY
jgi:hypothetical protein